MSELMRASPHNLYWILGSAHALHDAKLRQILIKLVRISVAWYIIQILVN